MINETNAEDCKKIEKYSSEILALHSKIEKTIKNIKRCRENCQSTSVMIGELNDAFKNI